jgi:hypothetical protein
MPAMLFKFLVVSSISKLLSADLAAGDYQVPHNIGAYLLIIHRHKNAQPKLLEMQWRSPSRFLPMHYIKKQDTLHIVAARDRIR